MGKRIDTYEEWEQYYQKLADKNYHDFQQSGISRYYRAHERYELVAECIRAKIRERTATGEDRDKQKKKIMDFIDYHLYKQEYTRTEVAELLLKTVGL